MNTNVLELNPVRPPAFEDKFKKLIAVMITSAIVITSSLIFMPQAKAYEPFQKTFIITAYYSPLPGQEFYVTGSLERDKRLNGNGTNGADGTPVYEGLIAAPGTYAFGTRINCPGVMDGEIHDRGGAIVKAGIRSNAYDRLDFWAGYGDEGLKKALFWGKRTLTCTMYPPGYAEFKQYAKLPMGNLNNLALKYLRKPTTPLTYNNYIAPRYANLLNDLGYQADDKTERIAFQIRHKLIADKDDPSGGNVGPATRNKLERIYSNLANHTPSENLEEGNISGEVRKLQTVLQELGYLKTEPTAIFGPKTKDALIAFQLDKDIIDSASHQAAGFVGPATRKTFKEMAMGRFRISAEDKYQISLMKAGEIKAQLVAKAEALAANRPEEIMADTTIDPFEAALQVLSNEWVKEHKDAEVAGESITEESTGLVEETSGVTFVLANFEKEDSFQTVRSQLEPIVNPFDDKLLPGSVHPEVRKIQTVLRDTGYFDFPLITDYFGPATKKAVVAFQMDVGIIPYAWSNEAGIIGPKTIKALNAAYYKDQFSLPHSVGNQVRAPAVHPDDLKFTVPLKAAASRALRSGSDKVAKAE